MPGYRPLSILIEATLLSFKDVIISDGLQMMYPISMGGNMKRSFKDVYAVGDHRPASGI